MAEQVDALRSALQRLRETKMKVAERTVSLFILAFDGELVAERERRAIFRI